MSLTPQPGTLITAIGIDIGGTKIKGSVVQWDIDTPITNESVTFLATEQYPTPTQPTEYQQQLVGLVNRLCQAYRSITGDTDTFIPVGISSAGIFHPETGDTIGSTGNLPALKSFQSYHEILSPVSDTTLLAITNDANAAAYGEYRALNEPNIKNMLMVTLGTGIGGGAVIDGKLYSGAHGSALEVGHMRLSRRSGRDCTCGLRGCWEAYGSGNGLCTTVNEWVARARSEEGDSHPEWQTSPLLDSPMNRTATKGAKENDPLSLCVMTQWHEDLAVGLANLGTILNPQRVVIGGGLGDVADMERLESMTQDFTLAPEFKMVHSQWGNDAGLLGAALWAHEHLPHKPETNSTLLNADESMQAALHQRQATSSDTDPSRVTTAS